VLLITKLYKNAMPANAFPARAKNALQVRANMHWAVSE
jgi:hypothetical protein